MRNSGRAEYCCSLIRHWFGLAAAVTRCSGLPSRTVPELGPTAVLNGELQPQRKKTSEGSAARPHSRPTRTDLLLSLSSLGSHSAKVRSRSQVLLSVRRAPLTHSSLHAFPPLQCRLSSSEISRLSANEQADNESEQAEDGAEDLDDQDLDEQLCTTHHSLSAHPPTHSNASFRP